MIFDTWGGLGVYRSPDALHGASQQENLLAGAELLPTDRSPGHPADVAISWDHLFPFYFVLQEGPDMVPSQPESALRSSLQVVKLIELDGQLKADRNRSAFASLDPAGERCR